MVAAWAEAVHAIRRAPLYSASWGNVTLRRVASKLGLILYGSDFSLC
ncbi:MAG TPA: hypothetical protein VF808_11410 [Ktedonobacterales bacterium]